MQLIFFNFFCYCDEGSVLEVVIFSFFFFFSKSGESLLTRDDKHLVAD